ncbi:MAG: hypothetical protein WD874_02050 [Parcubacteria group bacterium]
MSDDKIGSVVRALVGVPKKYLGIILDVVNRLNEANADNSAYRDALANFNKNWRKSLVEALGLKDFFLTRDGLWVSDDFRNRILAKAEIIEAVGVKNFDLPRDMADAEIEKELSEGHIFDESTVCVVIRDLIEKQWGGTDGVLKNNGYANLFYTPSSVVGVRWGGGRRMWNVDIWVRDGIRWLAGSRAFSPATDSQN